MIKSILDNDEKADDLKPGDDPTSSGSILGLEREPSIVEPLDPFAITDHHISSGRSTESRSEMPSKTADELTSVESTHTPREREYFSPTAAQTVRMSGLAWSAGIMFFGSVGFMLVLGWLVDTVLGSSPWGIVGGIVLGSIIGFVQLIRINTQILNPHSSAPRSLMDQAGADRQESNESQLTASPIADLKTDTTTPDLPSVSETPNAEAPYALENDSTSEETDDSPRPL